MFERESVVRKFLRASMQPRIRWRAIKVSLFVGTLLNVINQSGAVLHGAAPSWRHVLLNYLVPFAVSTYSAAKIEIERDRT